jgi:hypothetical protein
MTRSSRNARLDYEHSAIREMTIWYTLEPILTRRVKALIGLRFDPGTGTLEQIGVVDCWHFLGWGINEVTG